jgi:hypothetical protein
MADDPVVRRVERALGAPGLVDRLAALPPADVTSLLLAVARRRADAASLLRAHARSALVRPTQLDPRARRTCERQFDELLPDGYERIDLAPVTPLGASHVLGATAQDWVVSAGRSTEVVSDPTVVLALECALRRRALRPARTPVHLATVQRTLRAQPFPPPAQQHFALGACCSAGRDEGGHGFDVAALLDHVAVCVGLAVRRAAPGLRVELTPLRVRFPEVRFGLDAARQDGEPGYYVRSCFRVWSDDVNLADGGFTDWCARLLGDRKERVLTSGIGLDRLAA